MVFIGSFVHLFAYIRHKDIIQNYYLIFSS